MSEAELSRPTKAPAVHDGQQAAIVVDCIRRSERPAVQPHCRSPERHPTVANNSLNLDLGGQMAKTSRSFQLLAAIASVSFCLARRPSRPRWWPLACTKTMRGRWGTLAQIWPRAVPA